MNRRAVVLVRRSILLLILGAITTLAVSWGCALWMRLPHQVVGDSDLDTYVFNGNGFEIWYIARDEKPGGVRITSDWETHLGPSSTMYIQRDPDALIPRWADGVRPIPLTGQNSHLRVADGRGWPLPAMWSHFEIDYDSYGQLVLEPTRSSGVRLPVMPGTEDHQRGDVRFLPLRIIPAGFMIDAIVFSSMWFVFWTSTRVARSCSRRVIRRAVVVGVVLGFFTTVILAWLPALLPPKAYFEGRRRWCHAAVGGGDTVVERSDMGMESLYKTSASASANAWTNREPPLTPAQLLPTWAAFLLPPAATSQETRFRLACAAGWPMRAMWSDWAVHASGEGNSRTFLLDYSRHGIRSANEPQGYGLLDPGLRALPLGIIWPGLIFDTLIHGFFWFIAIMLFLTPFQFRRARRRRRGRCERCNYNLRGAPHMQCPECGAAVHLPSVRAEEAG